MADSIQESHRILIDRANRLLRQSRALRKLSEELRQESQDVRKAAKAIPPARPRKKG